MSDAIRFEPLPKNYKATKGAEVIIAEGLLEVEMRHTTRPTETIVGGFDRENGYTSIASIDSALEHLNGCTLRVKIEILDVPKEEEEH